MDEWMDRGMDGAGAWPAGQTDELTDGRLDIVRMSGRTDGLID